MTKANVLESALTELYTEPSFLPPLWRVIFQEAMRDNHIIFPSSLPEKAQSFTFDQASHHNDEMGEFCVHLFAAPDLKTIKAMVRFLPEHEQILLFLIYLNQMDSIRQEYKSQAN